MEQKHKTYAMLQTVVLTIIMDMYHVLINTLSTHMMHTNLNTIFYTRVEQSYQNNIHKVLYGKKQTHTLKKKHNKDTEEEEEPLHQN